MSDSKEVKKVGFAAFADKYNDRWAANHPNAARKSPAAATTEPAAPLTPDAPVAPNAKPETKA